jgi:hypothetical protein
MKTAKEIEKNNNDLTESDYKFRLAHRCTDMTKEGDEESSDWKGQAQKKQTITSINRKPWHQRERRCESWE